MAVAFAKAPQLLAAGFHVWGLDPTWVYASLCLHPLDLILHTFSRTATQRPHAPQEHLSLHRLLRRETSSSGNGSSSGEDCWYDALGGGASTGASNLTDTLPSDELHSINAHFGARGYSGGGYSNNGGYGAGGYGSGGYAADAYSGGGHGGSGGGMYTFTDSDDDDDDTVPADLFQPLPSTQDRFMSVSMRWCVVGGVGFDALMPRAVVAFHALLLHSTRCCCVPSATTSIPSHVCSSTPTRPPSPAHMHTTNPASPLPTPTPPHPRTHTRAQEEAADWRGRHAARVPASSLPPQLSRLLQACGGSFRG
eukprot:352693-Chlamydomonas_euryale.AAC.1